MNEPCFEYHKIDTFDIWEYERQKYLENNSNDEHITNLKKRYEEVIIYTNRWQKKEDAAVTVAPFTDIHRFDNGKHKGYFDRNIRDLHNANTTKDHVALNYFMVRDDLFSFKQTIYINPNHRNFDYWFSLKLGQYTEGLKYLNGFLNSTLKELFNNDFKSCIEFIEVAMLQFEKLLSPSLMKLISKWIEKTPDLTAQPKLQQYKTKYHHTTSTDTILLSNKSKTDTITGFEKSPSTNFNPLLREVVRRDIDWGEEQQTTIVEVNKTQETEELCLKYHSFYSPRIKASRDSNLIKTLAVFDLFFSDLVSNGFLSKEENTSKQLLDLFSNKNISPKNIIKWQGTAYELRRLAQIIDNNKLCTHIGGLLKWKIVQKCFHCKLKGKPMGPIEKFTSISEAKITVSNKSQKLIPIVDKLTRINL